MIYLFEEVKSKINIVIVMEKSTYAGLGRYFIKYVYTISLFI